jgi:hypothetical protein
MAKSATLAKLNLDVAPGLEPNLVRIANPNHTSGGP